MGLMEVYDYYWNEMPDPKTVDLPLMRSPIFIPSILFSYLYFVLRCGPRFMKNRTPYNLKSVIRWYNVFQIFANGLAVQQLIKAGWFTEISVICEQQDYSSNPKTVKIAHILWFITMTKIADLIETVMFVLRKKDNQISILHLYHHVSTLLICWLMVRYVPVAGVSFPLMVNCGVHVIMYTYYLLSSFGPAVQKVLNPFKPVITIIQMVQFVGLVAYSIQTYFPYCNESKTPSNVLILDLIINFILFYNFYKKAYVKRDQKMK